MDLIKLTIDNREVEVPKGTTVLKAAQQMGIDIPTLCNYPIDHVQKKDSPCCSLYWKSARNGKYWCQRSVTRICLSPKGETLINPTAVTISTKGTRNDSHTYRVRRAKSRKLCFLVSLTGNAFSVVETGMFY